MKRYHIQNPDNHSLVIPMVVVEIHLFWNGGTWIPAFAGMTTRLVLSGIIIDRCHAADNGMTSLYIFIYYVWKCNKETQVRCMKTAIVGERGQVTIPKKLRDRFGIKSGSPVVFELRDDGILIKPAATAMVREFQEDFIKNVAKVDRLRMGEKKDILAKWKVR